ncbi:hypothetical protein VNO77_01971 [Canavalia gladiata]|uniref:Uncharacterized protein n=1 Tax=Canavalia gladiata TaxID=3824 RepID=A0AAN9MSD0_CANGL
MSFVEMVVFVESDNTIWMPTFPNFPPQPQHLHLVLIPSRFQLKSLPLATTNGACIHSARGHETFHLYSVIIAFNGDSLSVYRQLGLR